MKKNNQEIANKIKQQAKVLAEFDNATLCGAVANIDEPTILAIAKMAEKKAGNYGGLKVNNSKTKRSAFVGIVGEELAEKVFASPSAVGPIYNMVYHIQNTKFGLGATAPEKSRHASSENANRVSNRRRARKGVVINDDFDLACVNLGFNPDNLSEWEEEQAMVAAGWIN